MTALREVKLGLKIEKGALAEVMVRRLHQSNRSHLTWNP